MLPEPFNHVFFTNSGSESVDTALKIAMAYHRARGEGQRLRFVSRERAYHGVNIGGTSLAGMVRNRETFGAVMPNVVTIRHTWDPADDLHARASARRGAELADDLQRHCETYGGGTIAAVFVEPVAGSTGTLVPPKGYLRRLREICDAHGILLVFDEVITGFGRLGAPFAVDAFGVTPDVITMAKALTNGAIPMGAVAVSRPGARRRSPRRRPRTRSSSSTATPTPAIRRPAPPGSRRCRSTRTRGCSSGRRTLSDYFLDAVWSLRDLPVVRDIRGLRAAGRRRGASASGPAGGARDRAAEGAVLERVPCEVDGGYAPSSRRR